MNWYYHDVCDNDNDFFRKLCVSSEASERMQYYAEKCRTFNKDPYICLSYIEEVLSRPRPYFVNGENIHEYVVLELRQYMKN